MEILKFCPPPAPDGGGDDDGRISSNLQPPLPIAPRDEISRSGKPLTPINISNFIEDAYGVPTPPP